MQQEEIKGGEEHSITSASSMHERFANAIDSLQTARNKAKNSKFDKIVEEIDQLINSAVDKLNEIDKNIQPAFKNCTQDLEIESYNQFNDEQIKKINFAFSIIESFYNRCKNMNKEIG